VTDARGGGPECFRFLATFLAGRPLGVRYAPAGEAAYTDGHTVFVSAHRPQDEQRREVLIQSALLGAGSLEATWVRALRHSVPLARRYLAVEGRRVCAQLAVAGPLASVLGVTDAPASTDCAESLQLARSRHRIAEPPGWFGVIQPSRLLRVAVPKLRSGRTPAASALELRQAQDVPEETEERRLGESKLLKLFENPLFSSKTLSDFFYQLFGASGSGSDGHAGAEAPIRALRRVGAVGSHARPVPLPVQVARHGSAAATLSPAGADYPEWDVHQGRYRPRWCRVLELPLTDDSDVTAAGNQTDERLRQRLSRLGLGPRIYRRRPAGDDIDIEALIDLHVDLRSGHSPPEQIYIERRKLARDLGVLILVDVSGSADESDPAGLSIHEHQRRAAATLAAILEDLGDRVAVYGCRSHGRRQVQLLGVKSFDQRFGAGPRARLNQLQPEGYTRLGAAIRHAGTVLKAEAGTPHRLLLLLSDGVAYDDGYEARYAEADVDKALEELRADGVACLCLAIGAATPAETLERVFASASRASAASLSELSARMDQLFLGALAELAAPNPRASRLTRFGRTTP
jgi:hypothetical protein